MGFSVCAELRQLSVVPGAFPALVSWGGTAEMLLAVSQHGLEQGLVSRTNTAECRWPCPVELWSCLMPHTPWKTHFLLIKVLKFCLQIQNSPLNLAMLSSCIPGDTSSTFISPGGGCFHSWAIPARVKFCDSQALAGSGPSCLMAHLFPSQWSRELLLHQVSGYSCAAVITLVRK